MSIICATNFSDAALSASTLAARLAHKSGEPLWLVHVLNPDSVRAFGKPLREAAEAALGDQVKRLEQLGAKVEHALLTGEPAVEVETLAREKGATLVVTSAPSHEAPFLSVGGTVDRLAQSLTVPLLSVREEGAPFHEWVKGARPLRVMLGVDRSLPFEAAREWVRALRKWGPVEVVGGRVYWPEEEYQRLGIAHPMVYAEATPDLKQALEKETVALLAPLAEGGAPPRFRLELGLGRIADHLVDVAAQEKVDLLVVGTHHRRAFGRLWSVSHHALRLARMSVACVPAGVATGADLPMPSYRDVMVATDFSDTGNRAVAHAFSLVAPGGTVHLVHVAEGKANEAELRRQLLAVVPKGAEGGGRRVQVEVLPASRDVAECLTKAAERLGVDAVVMGTSGRSGLKRAVLGSVAQEVLVRTDRPVLVVRPPKG